MVVAREIRVVLSSINSTLIFVSFFAFCCIAVIALLFIDSAMQCSNCSKTARGSSAVIGQEVYSRHARCMWDWEGTVLDPSVGGGSALSSKILHGMQCKVVDGGRVVIRSKPFIDSEVI